MMSRNKECNVSRAGFTLVEMLVALTVILVLAAVAIAVLPTLNNYQKTTKASGLVQEWLLTAKQRALRDQLPRGVRLIADSNGLVRTLQYIEQPPDFSAGSLAMDSSGNVTGSGMDFTGGFTDSANYAVRIGDYLTVSSQPYLFLIIGVTSPTQLQVGIPATGFAGFTTTSQYLIIRSPRPLVGEPDLLMPQDTVIDLSGTPQKYSSLPPDTGNYDILFAPSGAVIRMGATTGKFHLWIRDESLDPDASGNPTGEQIVISIYTRTGLIASNPGVLNAGGTADFSFSQDGRSSGL